jgi:Tfp pilus assembly protein PilO
MPKVSAVKSQQKLLDTATQQGEQLTAQVGALEQAKRDARKVRQQLEAIDAQIPSTVALPVLLRQIRAVADRAAVDFVQISPGSPSPSVAGTYSIVPTQVAATGSYFAVTEFLYRLETLPRAVRVLGLNLSAGPNGLPQLQLQLTAEVYTTDTSAGPGSVPGPSSTTTGGA